MYDVSRFHFAPGPLTQSAHLFLSPAVCTREDLFRTLEQGLKFPDYFGNNWDALIDCLSDLSWLEAAEVVIAHEGLPSLPRGELRLYLTCLQDVLDRLALRGHSAPGLRLVFREADRAAIEAILADEASATGTHHVVHREVDLECIDGIAVELRHILPKGWTFTRQSNSFVVRGTLSEGWEDQLWKVVRFLTYPEFLSLQRTHKDASGERYEMVSASGSELAFRIEFIFTSAG
jgi:barstar (barnase inhibitor)